MSETAPEATDPAADPAEAPDVPQAPTVGPNGFPLNTKPEDMSSEHAAAYWRHEARRQQDFNKANSRRIKELEPKAAERARSDGEKAGREAALAEARERYGSQAVAARLAAAAERKGLDEAAILRLAGKPSRFLGDEGVDEDALADFLAALPDKASVEANTPRPQVRDIGGGSRERPKVDGLQAGAALFAARHGKTASA